ncbi:hypothetical protein [Luteolibacter sp. LG18]|uniref:hypothetical protein n=1 Tax=Luteolibacter sp. LG18 TaxID=2819286 RepID=UPI002B2F5DDD|nr:hypothetical protein llg_27400 [Luteolibacter sp. LG18]
MSAKTDPFSVQGARRVIVIGHPAHELAIYGLLQRHRPHVVVITDGGGEERERQSKEGLERIGLLERATYLGYSEASFYDGLLDRNDALFARVAADLRAVLERLQPDQVFCDAIEFYNPVHDITRPIVLRALEGLGEVPLYEIPLVYQKPAETESYEIQRVPEACVDRRFQYRLTPEELAHKTHARDHIYLNLREQAGPEFLVVTPEHLALEELADAAGDFPEAASSGRVLRYEWRANVLKDEGAIERTITYREHFLPAVAALVG